MKSRIYVLITNLNEIFIKRRIPAINLLQEFTNYKNLKEENDIHEKKIKKFIPMFCFYYNLVDKMKFFFSNRKKFFIKKFAYVIY